MGHAQSCAVASLMEIRGTLARRLKREESAGMLPYTRVAKITVYFEVSEVAMFNQKTIIKILIMNHYRRSRVFESGAKLLGTSCYYRTVIPPKG